MYAGMYVCMYAQMYRDQISTQIQERHKIIKMIQVIRVTDIRNKSYPSTKT